MGTEYLENGGEASWADKKVERRIQAGQPYVHPLLQPVAVAGKIDWSKVETGLPKAPAVATPAYTFLKEAAAQMEQRAQLRDTPGGERSMERIVNTFNALTGHKLTVAEGWEFMVLLKMVRGRQGKFHADDYTDGAAYFSLLGEEESTRDRS